ncbi:AraC family transcriptional regulator [Paenibacillus allorhizosphaerae]|uniref:HTH-type transcriptional activator RhaR n=1 Tax=Paenibacillus allorhizosphaerae TaxID=2849866 RepID=A0ABN7TX43_9BACL|nr:helix-turn-helix domain-containing protein [Paenibacillus allorhizosphaerae]CAG7654325.1 HTH-type transcriptional activator RhaR [Paenibacillus allorhizosphaerae]
MFTERIEYKDDLDLKFQLGNLIINVLYITYQPPTPTWSVKNHSHSSLELHFIPFGKGTLQVGKRTYDITPGCFYITGPEVFHQQKTNPDEPMSEFCINIELKQLTRKSRKTSYFIQSEVDQLFHIFTCNPFWFGDDTENIAELCKQIMLELNNPRIGCYSVVQNLISQIVAKAARCITGDAEPNYSLPKKIVNDRRRDIVDDFFRLNPAASKSHKTLASRIGVSIRQLNRILIQYYGMTFSEKLRHHRIENAKVLLNSTDWTVKKIAEEVGFADTGYFHEMFREVVKLTPTEYRESVER